MSTRKPEQDQERWLDFMEDELDPSLREDLSKMLFNHSENRKLVKEFATIKSNVKKLPAAEIPNDEKYFDQLHDKIMNQIAKEKPVSNVIPLYKRQWFSYVAAACAVMVLGSVFYVNLQRVVGVKSTGQVAMIKSMDYLLETSARHSSDFKESIVSSDSEDEFILDTTSKKLDKMTDAQAEQLLKEMIR